MKVGGLTNYVYVLYGQSDVYFTEAAYSIGTLLEKIDPAASRVIVFTDQPEWVRSLPVSCESIAGEINEMKGQFGFGLRVKLCSILKCAESFLGNIIFLDCDTIVHGPIQKIAARLGSGRAFMYRREKLTGRYPQFEGFQMKLPDGSAYRFSADSCMFNSGVIGLHHDDAKILKTALAICDGLLLEGRKNHVCEQLAVSEALRISGLKILTADKEVTHYYRASARRYMRSKLSRYGERGTKDFWNFDRPIPYSYPRVQLFKLMEKICK